MKVLTTSENSLD